MKIRIHAMKGSSRNPSPVKRAGGRWEPGTAEDSELVPEHVLRTA